MAPLLSLSLQEASLVDYPANWYGPAIEAGLRPIRLGAGTKHCLGGPWESNILSSVEAVRAAFTQGFNVGFLLVGKEGIYPNALGIWVNDIDSQTALDHFGDAPFTLMVSRNHPAKRHLYGRLPDPSMPRHTSLIRNSHDVKLNGIVVGPGSVHKEGGIYEAFQRNTVTGVWQPWDGTPIRWDALPVIDPTPYMPPPKMIMLSVPQACVAKHVAGDEWVFQDTGSLEAPEVPFATATGDPITLSYRGEAYIRNRIRCNIFSKSGNGGRATLLVIATHLVRYLRLPPNKVMDLLVHPVHGESRCWNNQCIDAKTKEPYPWSYKELESAIAAAQCYIPAYGVMEYKRLERIKAANERLVDFWILLGYIPPQPEPMPAMSAQEVYNTFLELYSVDPTGCSYRRFACAFQKARRGGLVRLINARGGGRKKLRYYRGINHELLDLALEFRSEEEAEGPNAA